MEKTVDLIVPCFNEGEVLELFHSEVRLHGQTP